MTAYAKQSPHEPKDCKAETDYWREKVAFQEFDGPKVNRDLLDYESDLKLQQEFGKTQT